MRIIPAIDIINGEAVRLEEGDFLRKKVYASDPIEVAKLFEDAGLTHLHLVDLDGAKVGAVQNQKILEQIKKRTGLTVDYGGGIRRKQDVQSLKDAGADQVNIGSMAVKNEEATTEIIDTYGADFIVLSPDVKDRKVAIHGWQQTSDLDILSFITNYKKRGVEYFVCTDIAKDGMLQGSSIKLYKFILDEIEDISLIASGGVTDISELEELEQIGVEGAIIGKAIYENRISLNQLLPFLTT